MDAGLLQRQHSLAPIESGGVKEFHMVMAGLITMVISSLMTTSLVIIRIYIYGIILGYFSYKTT